MLGFLLIDKPRGLTSHDVIYRLRKKLGIKRIGHAGTLDPMATGLLVVGVGPATRFLPFLQLEPKEYEFRVEFGRTTETYDTEGSVTSERPVPADLESRISAGLCQFLGDIEQMPPVYSAVKKDGRPLYSYARKGEAVERKARRIRIEELGMTRLDSPSAEFKVVCSSGTYVRSIAHDLGERVGCGGHATSIRRTRAGRFSVSDAVDLETVSAGDIINARAALAPMPCVSLDAVGVEMVGQGRPIAYSNLSEHEKHVFLSDLGGSPLGIAEVSDGTLHPKCMLPREEGVAQR